MARLPVPLAAMPTRLPEHGRIRLGVKTAKAMKSIDTFRFTSPDESVIQQIAEVYGGTPQPWNHAKASPRNQFEVISNATAIRVWLPPDAFDIHYELWGGGGLVRRCDGETAELPVKGGEPVDYDCACLQRNVMECKPYSRLRVILPDVRFGGCWRMETKGWNAAAELPEMVSMLERLRATGFLEAVLRLESRQSEGGGKKFVVPTLDIGASPEQMLAGGGRAMGALDQGEVASPVEAPALTAATDDDIVEAEIIDETEASVTEIFPGAVSAVVEPGIMGTAQHELMEAARTIKEDPGNLEIGVVSMVRRRKSAGLEICTEDEVLSVIKCARALREGRALFAGYDDETMMAKLIKAEVK